jgi:hypothetical protein
MDDFPYLRPTIHTVKVSQLLERKTHLEQAVSLAGVTDSDVRVLQIVIYLGPERAVGESILV